jgi:hypothetical protein
LSSSLLADTGFKFDCSNSAEFSDPSLGLLRQELLENAGRLLGIQFADDATIQLTVFSKNDSTTDKLASAAIFRSSSAESVAFLRGVIQGIGLED